jgi:hypothetical protein
MCYRVEDAESQNKQRVFKEFFFNLAVPLLNMAYAQISENPTLAASKPLLSCPWNEVLSCISQDRSKWISSSEENIWYSKNQRKEEQTKFTQHIHYHRLRPRTPSRHSLEGLLATTLFYRSFRHFLRTVDHGATSVIKEANRQEVCGAGSNIGLLKKLPLSDTANKTLWMVYRNFLIFTDRTGEYPTASL